tara:strand:- start:304 stop:648 length:345 start_codon:yes stop_codon:yes gene_type:complete
MTTEHTKFDNPLPNPDWVSKIVDRIVNTTKKIQTNTTQPIFTIFRGIIFAIAIIICVLTSLVFLGIGVFQLIDLALPGKSWTAYLCTGGILCLGGGIFWKKCLKNKSSTYKQNS